MGEFLWKFSRFYHHSAYFFIKYSFILFINFIFFLDDKIRFTQKKTIFAFSLQF